MSKATMLNLEVARKNLSQFIMRKTADIQKQLGFGYVDSDNAPCDYESLQEAFANSSKTHFALPVWNGCSENTIYTDRGVNWAFRYWHDVLHCQMKLGFDPASEKRIGTVHVKHVQDSFGIHSLEALLMYADTIGQTMYAELHNGVFPDDQLEFAKDEIEAYILRINDDQEFDSLERMKCVNETIYELPIAA
jgi:hypothetical protein